VEFASICSTRPK